MGKKNCSVRPETTFESPCYRLIRVEVYVCLMFAAFAFLVIFGSFRRRSHNGFLKLLVWATYVLSPSLMSYATGLMQSANFKDEFFPIWALFFLIVFGSADSISAYRLEDIDQRLRYWWECMVLSFWVGWLIGQHVSGDKFKWSLELLFLVYVFKLAERVNAFRNASRSFGLVRHTKLIADFMSYEHELNNQDQIDPTRMKGYNYIIRSPSEEKFVKVAPPHYKKRIEITDEVITIHKVWECPGRLLSSRGDPDGRLKDLCLSFALFKLLCRKFAGYPSPESHHVKTWDFVRHGLLHKEDDYERAFRVIEVELAFVFDFFYTKYSLLSEKGYLLFRISLGAAVMISCCVLAATLVHHHYFTFDGYYIDDLVTVIVIIAVLVVETAQFVCVIFSDWTKVSLLCKYVQKPSWQNNKHIEKMIKFICDVQLLNPWEKKIGQYSFLESFDHKPSKLIYNDYTLYLLDKPKKGEKESTRIKLPVEVKKAVIFSLKTNGRRLTNGEASLRRNGVENEFSWACRLETQTSVIMIWHIATSLCEIASRKSVSGTEQVRQTRQGEHFLVATSLSRYCAYLVVFAPRLLPDHAYVTEFIFTHVVDEAREVLEGCESMDTRYQKMMKIGEDDDPQSIIERGAALGKRLIEGVEDEELRWKVLADLWADLMLFVAPSDDARAHAESLATGGEFVTHLWALLSHAGILRRDSDVQDV